jgi:gliding motility-associated-like protein
VRTFHFTFLSLVLPGIIWGLLTGLPLHAQQSNFTPLQFTENKGQWEGDFQYKTDLDGGTVYLKENGFTFYLFHKGDYTRFAEFVHGHAHPSDGGAIDPTPDGRQAASPPAAATAPGAGRPPAEKPLVRGHAYEVTFLNAAAHPQISPDKPMEGYSNYFLGSDPARWKSEVRSYQRIRYNGLYPGIDMHVYSEASLLKYDLIVHPGANPSDILLQYNGATRLELKKGQLEVTTTVGTLTELMPYAYQYINEQRVPIKVSYRLKGNQVSFKVSGKYDPQYPLVIDPTYVFSTVTGARADNWGFTATYDAQGNFYGGGIIKSDAGYPTTPGAIQSVYGRPGFDMGITKFNPTGRSVIYSTYLGGEGSEQPHSLFVDAQGNLVISGRTTSGNFPFTGEVGRRGGWDIAVVKLNSTGTAIIGSLRIGGSANDGVNISENRQEGDLILLKNYGDDARSEVVVDGAGDIYVASCTRSGDFPVTAGVFQPTYGGSQDGVVMKINSSCSGLIWASYIGGSKEDAAYVLALNGNTLYVAGGTASANFRTTGGTIYPGYRGGPCDGFIAHLQSDGTGVLQATYLGSDNAAADQVYGVQLDSRGYVYVMGTTEGNWPEKRLSPGAPFYNDNSRQFIAKLQPNLSAFVYSTTFGKQDINPSISPVAFLVDRCENVYVSGWGGGLNKIFHYHNSGTRGLPVKNALDGVTDDQDFYFFVLQRDATDVLYASFFGGDKLFEHVDGGTSRFDRNGIIYQGLCAWCMPQGMTTKPPYPVTPGAYTTAAPPECNLGALKIAFNLDGVKAGIRTLDRRKNYCIPSTIIFADTTGRPAQSWTWDFGDGTPPVSGGPETDTLPHTYSRTGNYRIRLIKCDPASCNGCDTVYTEVRLREDSAHVALQATREPPCTDLKYTFHNRSLAAPGKPFAGKPFVLDLGDGTPPVTLGMDDFPYVHQYRTDGIYNVLLTLTDTSYCNAPDTDTIHLRVAANVVADFTAPDTACAPATITFENTTRGGETFFWDFGDGVTSTDIYPTHTFETPNRTYTVKMWVTDDNTCNRRDSIEKEIFVSGPPTADFSFTPLKPTENKPTSFVNQSIGAVSYHWSFGDGEISAETNPSHQYNKTGVYDVCLYATNQSGCVDTLCKQVAAVVIPLFDVPNAFSPNGDGRNDILEVRAFGVSRFNFRIFNRWGQLVFESNDPNTGWDGRFRGALQPMDAYAYTISITFSDGTGASRSGNITLLR